MANLVRARGYEKVKPPLGATIDQGHPLAHRLWHCLLFNEGGGARVNDLVTGKPGTLPTTTAYWVADGFSFSDNSQRLTIADQSIIPVAGTASYGMTMDAIVKISGNQQGSFLYADLVTPFSGGLSLGVGETSFTQDSPGKAVIALNESVAWHGTAAQIPTEQFVHVAITYSNANVATVYLEGVAIDTWTQGIKDGAANLKEFAVGGSPASAARSVGAVISTARLWTRTLTGSEVRQLAAEPYAFIQPPAPKFSYFGFNATSATITGTAAGASTASGTAVGTVTRGATGAGAATASGAATATVSHPAVGAGASTASGSATATVEHPATGAGASSASGTATATRATSGTAAGASTASGTATATVEHLATAAGAATASGSASGTVMGPGAGTATGSATSSGTAIGTVTAGSRGGSGPANPRAHAMGRARRERQRREEDEILLLV